MISDKLKRLNDQSNFLNVRMRELKQRIRTFAYLLGGRPLL